MTTTLADITHRAGVHAYYGRQLNMATKAGTPAGTEAWLESLGSTFVDVRLYLKHEWVDERHIADAETLGTTVSMSLERLGGRYAVWQFDGEWVLYDRFPAPGPEGQHYAGNIKRYPSQEAAEMVAMHRRG